MSGKAGTGFPSDIARIQGTAEEMPGPVIRPATPRDATDLVAFVDMAGEGLPSYFWSRMAEVGQGPFEVGRTRALREDGAFSWRNAHVAERDHLVAGGLVCYRIDDPVDLSGIGEMNRLARDLTLLESEVPGFWYVNVLAVYPEFRGQGIAAALLAYADDLGRRAGTRGMAIIVASENEPARRLYEKAGYLPRTSRPLVAHEGYRRGGDWILLAKPHA
jgi:ribosomal protein S18 acetylase RimI-like enzyme